MNTDKRTPQHTIADAAVFVHCNRRQRDRLEALSSIVEGKAGYQLTKEGRTGLEFGGSIEGAADVTINGRHVAPPSVERRHASLVR